MKRKIYWEQSATEQIAQLAARTARQATRILVAVREFGQANRGDIKKLQGDRNEWRLRAGNWRVAFELFADAVYVTDVADRQDAYN